MGRLFLVATPIGNLEDITLRALRVLRESMVIAAEDTRHSGRLLKHFDIQTPLKSFHEHSGPERLQELLDLLHEGDVALISDAGMPGISDPGYLLVREAIARGISVEPVPGPSAITAAVPASGFVPDGFLFLGFAPRRSKPRRELLESLAGLPYPLVLYEAPHRLAALLADLESTLGDRPLALCRELTKLHEEITRTTVAKARASLEQAPPRGEYVVIVGVAATSDQTVDLACAAANARQLLSELLSAGESPSSAAKLAARQTGLPRRQLYEELVALQRERDSNRVNEPDQ